MDGMTIFWISVVVIVVGFNVSAYFWRKHTEQNPRNHRIKIWSIKVPEYSCRCHCSPPKFRYAWRVQGTWTAGPEKKPRDYSSKVWSGGSYYTTFEQAADRAKYMSLNEGIANPRKGPWQEYQY